MKTLKIHASDLDSYQWYHRIERMTIDEMIGRLKRTEPPNEKMILGTIWHDILENPPDSISEIQYLTYIFKIECDSEINLPQIREVRGSKTYQIGDIKVILTGKCDGITGVKITDHKLTFRPNPENYINAFQWKSYLEIFGADIFEYIIYHAYQKGNVITIKDVYPMFQYRYPQMERDLLTGINELVNFIEKYVPELIQ